MAERDSGQPESAEGPDTPGREVGATSFLQRAVIRRRVRFLHRRRELALYDLGGFLFESHRLGQPHEEILGEKLGALTILDDELALLQRALDLHEEVAVLSEPGIAACSHCGTLRDSAANFCPGCGRPAAETLTLAASPSVWPAGEEDENVVLMAVPEPAADLSASPDTEIAAADEDEEDEQQQQDEEEQEEEEEEEEEPQPQPGSDATAEMPAVNPLAWQDAAGETELAAEPAEDDDLATPQDDEPADEADTAATYAHEPAQDAYLTATPTTAPAQELGEGDSEGTSAAAADAPS